MYGSLRRLFGATVSAGGKRSISSFQVFYEKHGDPNSVVGDRTLDLGEIGLKADQVRLKWLAAPLNPADINMIQGVYAIKPTLPAVVGNEGVAEVVEIGNGVTALSAGDRVIPSRAEIGGTWQQQMVTDARNVMPISKDVSVTDAAMLLVNPPTAYRMLKDFVQLKAGDLIVQNGATSAVGRYVIQLAREWGLKTVNLVRDRQKSEQELTSLGADYVIDYKQFPKMIRTLTEEHGDAKLALNCIGGDSPLFMAASLGVRGRLVTYGAMSKQPMKVPTGPLIFKQIELHGYWMSSWYLRPENDDKKQPMIEELCRLITSGKLRTPPCEMHQLHEYKTAIQRATNPEEGGACKQMVIMES